MKKLLLAIPERIIELFIKLISVKGLATAYFAILAMKTKDESDITYAFIMFIILIGAREFYKYRDLLMEIIKSKRG